ncbi:hypothetical protein ACIKTA_02485 [Hansschlegelia beijingensis]
MNRLRSHDPEQLSALLRTILQVVGVVVATKGWLSADDWALYSGAVLTIVPAFWGLWARTDTNLVKSAADVPAVDKIVAPGAPLAFDPEQPNVKSD